MKIPRSIELKMFLSEIRSSDFWLDTDNFITVLNRGMKLAGISNKQLAKRVWTKENEVRRWRAGINVPLALTQIYVLHTLEEMMEFRLSLTEWWEKMNRNLKNWLKSIGIVVLIMAIVTVFLLWSSFAIQTNHPFLYGVGPILLGLVFLFKKTIFP